MTQSSESLIGQTVAGVYLKSVLGSGGMADVYLGRHRELDQDVALKILHAPVRNDPTLMKQLQTEAAALVSMQHPNIVKCVDCNVYQGRPYIIMDLLEGITLEDRLTYLADRGLLPALNIVSQVVQAAASALDYAHQQGIVHRDLKPSNMMLVSENPEGELDPTAPLPQDIQVVLTDFGVARLQDATDQEGLVVGTPDYMSPEQASGKNADSPSDIYSLGVVTYRMLAGEVPHKRGNEFWKKLLTAFQNASVSDLWDSEPRNLPNTPDHLQRALRRALQVEPEGRYRRAGDFARRIQAAISTAAR